MNISEHTPNFSWDEVIFSKTAIERGIDNSLPVELKPYVVEFAENILQPLRSSLGTVIKSTSWYRNSKLNEAVGGVFNSSHTWGVAADIHSPFVSIDDLFREIQGMHKMNLLTGLDFCKKYKTFIHINGFHPDRGGSKSPRGLIVS